MAFIPEDKLLEIKDAARIEEVVGQYVQLTQKGKNLLGLCPFHADTSPSFTVAPEKGIFHCFGCGAGGNVFSFLMQHQRLSFPEAVQELARRYGIPLTFKELGPEGERSTRKRTLAYEINQVAAGFYEATLKSAAGQPGRDYLAKRGLTPEVIQAFHLGYAPDEWDSLRRHLQSRGLSLEVAQEAGLLAPRSGGGFYDRFRNRIIFPIFDRQSRVLAFGGRVIGQGEPKYLNSPESQLYHKGRTLYGLPQAAEALRQTSVALVVEGYLDLIALQAHGIANVLATLGTALTREQVRLLKNLAPRVVLVYDGDAAGIKAMQRAFPLFAQESLPVRALALPPGQDPDDYARSRGVEIFKTAWEEAQPWFTFLLEGLIGSHGLEVEGRVRILEELRPYFQAIADPVEQDLWLKTAAQRLGVDESVLRQSLASFATITASRLSPDGGGGHQPGKGPAALGPGPSPDGGPGRFGTVGPGVRGWGTEGGRAPHHRVLPATREIGPRLVSAAGGEGEPAAANLRLNLHRGGGEWTESRSPGRPLAPGPGGQTLEKGPSQTAGRDQECH